MNSVVLDTTALLAFLRRAPGSDRVGEVLNCAVISSVSLSEVIATAIDQGGALDQVHEALSSMPFGVLPFDHGDAYCAASLRPVCRHLELSPADYCCLALGTKLGLPVLTANEVWAGLQMPTGIEVIR